MRRLSLTILEDLAKWTSLFESQTLPTGQAHNTQHISLLVLQLIS